MVRRYTYMHFDNISPHEFEMRKDNGQRKNARNEKEEKMRNGEIFPASANPCVREFSDCPITDFITFTIWFINLNSFLGFIIAFGQYYLQRTSLSTKNKL